MDASKKKFLKSIGLLAGVLSLSALLFVSAPTANLDADVGTVSVDAANGGGEKDYSFYKISSAASSFFNKAMLPDDNTDLGAFNGATNGGATGALLGFSDANKTKGLVSFFSSLVSNSSASISYDSVRDAKQQGGGKGNTINTEGYIYYGAVLADLGLDRTGPDGMSLSFFSRFIAGWSIGLFYILSYVISAFFTITATILKWFNPFAAFYQAAITLVPSVDGYLNGEAPPGWMSGISGTLSTLYLGMKDIGLILTIPISIALLLYGIFLSRQRLNAEGGVWTKTKRIITRLIFIFFGIPILGSTYTASLDMMSNFSQTNPPGSTIVNSLFVDFKAWAQTSRLTMAGRATLQYDPVSGRAEGATVADLPRVAKVINGSVTKTNDTLSGTLGLIQRYVNGEKYYASDFETYTKSRMLTGGDADKELIKLFNEYSTTEGIAKVKDLDSDPLFGTHGGSLTYSSGTITASGSSYGGVYTGGNSNMNAAAATMSPITMYNYLSTSFGKKNLVVYSNEKASSGLVRDHHYSVNMIGQGIQPFFLWISGLVSIVVLVVIGFYYALGILIENMKRFIEMVVAIPFAAMGMISQISRVVAYTGLMIAEIMISMLLYAVTNEIVLQFGAIVETPLNTVLTPLVSSGAGAAAGLALMIVLIMVKVALLVWFTIKAIKLRSSIVKAFGEMTVRIIDKFFMTDSGVAGEMSAPKEPGLGKRALAGAGVMAGGALGQKLAAGGRTGRDGDSMIRGVATGDGTTSHNDDDDPDNPKGGGFGNPDDPNGPDGGGFFLPDGGSDVLESGGGSYNEDEHSRITGQNALEFDSLGDSASNRYEGMNEMKDGAIQTSEGAKEIASGGAKVAAAYETGDLATGIEGAQELRSGVNNVNEGAQNISSGQEKAFSRHDDVPYVQGNSLGLRDGDNAGHVGVSSISGNARSGLNVEVAGGRVEKYDPNNVVGRAGDGTPLYRSPSTGEVSRMQAYHGTQMPVGTGQPSVTPNIPTSSYNAKTGQVTFANGTSENVKAGSFVGTTASGAMMYRSANGGVTRLATVDMPGRTSNNAGGMNTNQGGYNTPNNTLNGNTNNYGGSNAAARPATMSGGASSVATSSGASVNPAVGAGANVGGAVYGAIDRSASKPGAIGRAVDSMNVSQGGSSSYGSRSGTNIETLHQTNDSSTRMKSNNGGLATSHTSTTTSGSSQSSYTGGSSVGGTSQGGPSSYASRSGVGFDTLRQTGGSNGGGTTVQTSSGAGTQGLRSGAMAAGGAAYGAIDRSASKPGAIGKTMNSMVNNFSNSANVNSQNVDRGSSQSMAKVDASETRNQQNTSIRQGQQISQKQAERMQNITTTATAGGGTSKRVGGRIIESSGRRPIEHRTARVKKELRDVSVRKTEQVVSSRSQRQSNNVPPQSNNDGWNSDDFI